MPKSKQKKILKPKETCASGHGIDEFQGFPPSFAYTRILDLMRDESSYIHEHLMTLYFIAKEFNCKRILEIGTGKGHSTLALALAAQKNGGHLTTIDIANCYDAKNLIEKHELRDNVTFLQLGKDIVGNVNLFTWDGPLDLVFVDGDHSKDAVMHDTYHYGLDNIVEGGFMICHDSCNPAHPGVKEALYTHNLYHKDKWRTYDWLHNNGLTLWRRTNVNQ